jgi:hypothetical protein
MKMRYGAQANMARGCAQLPECTGLRWRCDILTVHGNGMIRDDEIVPLHRAEMCWGEIKARFVLETDCGCNAMYPILLM